MLGMLRPEAKRRMGEGSYLEELSMDSQTIVELECVR